MGRRVEIETDRFLSSPLLGEASPESRLALAQAVEAEEAEPGRVLIQQGRPNDRLWFLVEGSVAIVRPEAGEERVIARLAAPGIFGATTFFHPGPPNFSVKATTRVVLYTLDEAGFDRLRVEHPATSEALALATLRVLAERFDLLDARVAEFLATQGDAHRRLTEWAAFRARLFEDPNLL